ncbi:MAG: hypothetical protein MRJ96_05655 [Nitrospirales bacterium]|nr:hypothetical protein [Nitrospira sp.]MDR4500919.1 hypothetical protein [Nitrospirales bacterium]
MSSFSKSSSFIGMALSASILVLSTVGLTHADDNRGRTVVVHINSFDADRVTNGLLFAKHTCQFLPDAADSTVRVLFSNAGVLNALKDIKHPRNRVPTLASGDDDPKHAKRLVRKLLGRIPSNPPLLCKVEVVATGLGLKTYSKTDNDLINGVQVGGPMISSPVQVPAFLTTPAEEGQPIVVIDW